jgi:nickel/cobalt exporter
LPKVPFLNFPALTLDAFYFPAAVALGALHALEPGHAKALTASYLIGIKGTKRDSILLGLSVAATHSIVVIGISAIGLFLGKEAFAGKAAGWLEMGSGFVAIVIGSWILWRRLALQHRVRAHDSHHHEATEPVPVAGRVLKGFLKIIDTPLGERLRFTAIAHLAQNDLIVEIDREGGRIEKLNLMRSPDNDDIFLSGSVPEEPHEFTARLMSIGTESNTEVIHFAMKEPEHGHGDHDHAHMDDIAHAQAHAATLPDYAKKGEKPSLGQIMLFGAAGGMVPCPASITVMLLALSTNRAGLGIFTVLGFSLGLALSLVGIGVIVVTGLSRLSDTGRFSWISRRAPVISASLVIVSGVFALFVAAKG